MTDKPAQPIVHALIAVQQELKSAPRDAVNPHFKSRYATLESCWDACKDALAKNGFAITNQTNAAFLDGVQAGISLTTTLWHVSGDSKSTTLPLLNPQGTMQGLGSALSYGRRYNLMGLLQICPGEDDDGNFTRPQPQIAPRPVAAAIKPALNQPSVANSDNSPPSPKQLDALFDASQASNWPPEECKAFIRERYHKSGTAELNWRECLQMTKFIADHPKMPAVETDFVDDGPFPFENEETK